MKLDKIEKFIITALVLLVTTTIITVYRRNVEFAAHFSVVHIPNASAHKLPENIRDLSHKFQAYEDLYKSDKLTLVYNYTTRKHPFGRDKEFHNTLSKKLEDEKLDIEKIVFKNWKDDSYEIEYKNKQYINETESCAIKGKDEQELDTFIKAVQDCIDNVCLIDVKNKQYTIISPDTDFIIKTIQEYNPAKN